MSRFIVGPRSGMPRREGRLRWTLAVFVVLMLVMVLLVWFAPTIIALTPLKQAIVARATGGMDIQVSVGKAGLGWLSPVVAQNIAVHDSQGQPLARVAVVRSEKSLAAILQNWHDLGTLYVEQPQLRLELRPDGSNWEDALRAWLQKPAEEPVDVGCAVEVRDGLIDVTDAASGGHWTAQGLNVSAFVPRDRQSPLAIRLQSAIQSGADAPGNLSAEITWQDAASGGASAGNSLQAKIDMAALPLGLLASTSKRFAGDVQLDGVLAGGAEVNWSPAQTVLRSAGLHIERLFFAAPQFLASDQVRLETLDVSGELALRGDGWSIRDVRLASDVARVEATGTGRFPWANAGSKQGSWVWSVLEADGQLRGEAKLAPLAAMLPSTLRVREATQVSSGLASWAVISEQDQSGHVWSGQLKVEGLAAAHQGRRVAWDQPVEIVAAARRDASQWSVSQFDCRASFLDLSAKGTLSEGQMRLQADLARFLAETGEFIDFGAAKLGGTLDVDVQWHSSAEGSVALAGEGVAKGLEMVLPAMRPLREEQLTVRMTGNGRMDAGRVERLEQATLQLVSGGDQLDLKLLEPVALAAPNADWPLQVHAEGELRSWLPRIQSLVALPGWDLQGTTKLDVRGRFAADRADLSSGKLDVTDLRADYGGLRIREPQVQLETTGSWDGARGLLASDATTLASTSLALRATGVRMQTQGEKFTLAGDAGYRLQLDRALAWLSDPQRPATYDMAGEATGNLRLQNAGDVTAADWTANVKDFRYSTRAPSSGGPLLPASQTSPWQTVWREPLLKLAAQGQYDAGQKTLDVSAVQLASQALSGGAKGRVREPFGRCYVDLEGNLAYDWQRLLPLLGPQTSRQLQVAGQGTRPFTFHGPLFAASSSADHGQAVVRAVSSRPGETAEVPVAWAFEEMAANASLGWQSMSLAGLSTGPGTLDAQLDKGVLTFAPLDLPVSEGRVQLAPQIDLKPADPLLTHPRGAVIQQVRLTPELCRGWLKYVAPVLADATMAEGQFSMSLDGAAVPLRQPAQGQVQGVLSVHSARVGPGPLSRQFLGIAEQIRAVIEKRPPRPGAGGLDQWLELPSQEVAFQMVDGRVHHQGLQLQIGDVLFRTKGAVGFDDSLALLAEVPIRDQWVADDRYLSALRGQTIQLPVQGTLGRPQVDGQALAQLTRQAVGGAATRLLEQELNRGLERLLRPQNRQ